MAQPDRRAANTAGFVKDDEFALRGYVGTPTCAAALPLVNQARIPFFGPFTGAEVLRDPFSKMVFHLRVSYDDETALIVKQLTALGLNIVAVFYQNDACGKAGLEGVTRALKARQAGYGGTFCNVSFVGTQALADELGREGNGIVVSQAVPYAYTGSSPIAREFQDAIKRSGTDSRLKYSSMEGYLAAKVFVEGLLLARRSPMRDQLVAGLESIQRADFGGFNVDFSPNRHVASNFVDLSMLTQDGKVRR